MQVPRYDAFFNPILQALHALGGSGTIPEMLDQVVEIMNLPPDVVEMTHSDGRSTLIEYRLGWARSYLKKVGLIDNSERGVWSLTQKGQTTTRVDPPAVRRAVRQMRDAQRAKPPEDDDEAPIDDDANQTHDWRTQLIEVLRAIPPAAFERLCQRLLRESGFIQVEVTGKSGDGGIDGHGIVRLAGLLSFPVIFQAKRYTGSVSPAEVRSFRGAMVGRAEKGLFITTGSFTASARAEATRDGAPPIDLVDGDDLAEKLKELKLGVKTTLVEAVDIDTAWFQGI